MRNLKISAKLILGFLIVVFVAAVIGGVGIFSLKKIDTSYTISQIKSAQSLPNIAKAIENMQLIRLYERNILLYTDQPSIDAAVANVNDSIEKFEQYLAKYDESIGSEEKEARSSLNSIKKLYNEQYKPSVLKTVQLGKEGKNDEALAELTAAASMTKQLTDSLTYNMDLTIKQGDDESIANTAATNNTLYILIGVLVLGVAISMFLAVYISRMISKPTKFLSDYMTSIANTGDLDLVESNKKYTDKYSAQRDEIGATFVAANNLFDLMLSQGATLKKIAANDLDHVVKPRSPKSTIDLIAVSVLDTLNSALGSINSSAVQVSSGAKNIANGAQALAQGATEQAAAVEQLSASIANVAATTKENETLANRAAALGSTIMRNAEKGSTQMDSMMNAVREINEASDSIGKVIKVIDDIAFQTNILALNAAVEAARAGQHGKGFAVVAEEVRNLAAKSAEAAKDTSNLIANSIEKAQLGAKIAQETSLSLNEIVGGITESGKIITDIAQSSGEQTSAIIQINEGINQVAQVVQINSASSQESAAAAEEMASLSDVLSEVASQFKLRGGSNRASGSNRADGRNSIPKEQSARPKKPDVSSFTDGFGKY